MIGRQFSVPLMVFLLHHRDGLSVTDILGDSFAHQSKEFQAEYLRISTIYELLRRKGEADAFMVATAPQFDKPAMPRAVGGEWVN